MLANDFKILKDEIKDGVRHITAEPGAQVCPVLIDIELIGDTVNRVIYTRGCNGNAKGIDALIKGMKVDEAVRRMKGITCGQKPTSCPDQLARILESLQI